MKDMTSRSQEMSALGSSEDWGRSPRAGEGDQWFIQFQRSAEKGSRLWCRRGALRNIRKRNGLAPIGLQFFNKSWLRRTCF